MAVTSVANETVEGNDFRADTVRRREALATLKRSKINGTTSLWHIDEPDFVFGMIHGVSAALSAAITNDGGLNDELAANALSAIGTLAALGDFATSARPNLKGVTA